MELERMRAFLIKFCYYALLIVLCFCLLKFVVPFFSPFVAAFLIAFVLKTPSDRLSKALRAPRAPVAVVLLIFFYAVAITIAVLLGAKAVVAVGDLIQQMPGFYTGTIEPAIYRIQDWLGGFFSGLDPKTIAFLETAGENLAKSLGSAVTSLSSSLMGSMTAAASGIPGLFVKMLLMIVASFFFVVDYYKVASFLAKLLPPSGRALLFRIKQGGVDTLFKFARAYAFLLGLTFVELSIGFSLLGVPNAILIAFLTAIVDILPVLGTGTILIPWGIYQLIAGRIGMGLGLLILYAIITVVRQSLEPRVVGHQIGLYPLATLLAMFAGTQLFGIWGLFGLPIALVVFIQLRKEDRCAAQEAAQQGEAADLPRKDGEK